MINPIEMEEIKVQYCPTELMWVDMLNKPKQDVTFRKNGAMLMNYPVESNNEVEHKLTNSTFLKFELEI